MAEMQHQPRNPVSARQRALNMLKLVKQSTSEHGRKIAEMAWKGRPCRQLYPPWDRGNNEANIAWNNALFEEGGCWPRADIIQGDPQKEYPTVLTGEIRGTNPINLAINFPNLEDLKIVVDRDLQELNIGNLRYLEKLVVNKRSFTSSPIDVIFSIVSLTDLDLSLNKLTLLPEGIGGLTSLTKLNLAYNQLTTLPSGIQHLTSLTKLYLHDNQLTSLPEEIQHLTSLTKLDLAFNQLTSLPEGIQHLTSLTDLNLYDNQLTSFPEATQHLTSLRMLSLSMNQISASSYEYFLPLFTDRGCCVSY